MLVQGQITIYDINKKMLQFMIDNPCGNKLLLKAP